MARQNATSAATVRALLLKSQAIELRRGGASYREIAQRLGIGKSRAHALVRAGLEHARAQVASAADEMRAVEVSRLDGMLAKLWPLVGKKTLDLGVVDRIIKIGERRAKLLGLDAPVRTAIQGGGDDTPPISTVSESKVMFYVPAMALPAAPIPPPTGDA
jgi:hypothetical protein